MFISNKPSNDETVDVDKLKEIILIEKKYIKRAGIFQLFYLSDTFYSLPYI